MIKLGEYLQLYNETNKYLKYSLDDLKGVSTKKMFIATKANMEGVSLHNYLVIKPKYFCYAEDTSRRGNKISLAFNSSQKSFIVSSSYVSFFVKNENELLPEYLFIYFNRPEFDRFARFNSWGSARETFSYEDLCNLSINIPPIEEQRKVVDVYLALVDNQKIYERGLIDLKLTCDAFIEILKSTLPLNELKYFVAETKEINYNKNITFERGLNKLNGFVSPGLMSSNVDISKRKIVRKNQFVYPSPHFGEQGTIGLFMQDSCIMSQMYTTFEIIDMNKILPYYLYLWLKREEFKRFAFFVSCDSIRDTFDFSKLCSYRA